MSTDLATFVFIISDIPSLETLCCEHLSSSSWSSSDKIVIRDLSADPSQILSSLESLGDQNVCILADPRKIASILESQSFVDFLSRRPRPIWLQSTWAGVESIINIPCISKGLIHLSRIGGIFGQQMAEYVLAHVIGNERRFAQLLDNQRAKVWNKIISYRKLSQLTIGIMGLGDIGAEVARAAKQGFNMNVWGLRRSGGSGTEFANVDRVFVAGSDESIDEFLSGVDYIVNILPHTAQTANLLSGDRLSCCQARKPVLINVGRGSVISECSIIEALDKGWLSGAILDVFAVEPLPESSPLWTHPNIIITPHVSAVSLGPDVADLFMRNLQRVSQDLAPLYLVDPSNGY